MEQISEKKASLNLYTLETMYYVVLSNKQKKETF